MNRKYSAQNERLKRDYFEYLREAKRYSAQTVDGVAKAIDRFESYTQHRDFRLFHHKAAVAFKGHLRNCLGEKGQPLSKATLNSTLSALRAFFVWLVDRRGLRPRFGYSDADYFNLSEKEARIATARRNRPGPTLEQVEAVLQCMPANTDIELRNRALVAFTLVTGARDGALASLKIKHIDLQSQAVTQDAREVKTKFSKTFVTFFFPVSEGATQIVNEWIAHLSQELLFGSEDPLFPATHMALNAVGQFEPIGLQRKHWTNATPIRQIFKRSFASAGLPYFNPHSFRKTLAQCAERTCRTPEEFKAWSQNLGHEGVLTTFSAYGAVPLLRQGELIRAVRSKGASCDALASDVTAAVLAAIHSRGLLIPHGTR
jgi:integrase